MKTSPFGIGMLLIVVASGGHARGADAGRGTRDTNPRRDSCGCGTAATAAASAANP